MILFVARNLRLLGCVMGAPSVRKQLSQDLTCMDAHFDHNITRGAGDADGRCAQLVALELTLAPDQPGLQG